MSLPTVIVRITVHKKSRKPLVRLELTDSYGNPVQGSVAGDLIPIKLGARRRGAATLSRAVAEMTPESAAKALNGAQLTSQEVRDLGEYLFRLLLQGKEGDQWREQRRQAGDGGLRTILQFDRDRELDTLRSLPWELMYERDGDAFLFLKESRPISRASQLGIRDPIEDWPLRILVINAAESGQNNIGADLEVRELEKMFAQYRSEVEYDLLEHPTPQAIFDACQQVRPHIFHFIGHAEAGTRDADPCLLLHRGSTGNRFEKWQQNAIEAALKNMVQPPRLAVLNACRTSGAGTHISPVDTDAVGSLFLASDVLAVIGMQADIEGDLAAAFSGSFYREVLRGTSLDVAVARSRLILMNHRTPPLEKEWALPVLKSRTHPDRVLPRKPKHHQQPGMPLRFVDRVPQRLQLREMVCGKPPAVTPHVSGLSVILGDADSGKSHFAQWCSHMYEWRGIPSIYLPFGANGIDLFSALRWIRDGQRPTEGQACTQVGGYPLRAAAFRHFNWELNWQLRGEVAPAQVPDPVVDEGRPWDTNIPSQENFIKSALQLYCAALETATQPRGLVLFLDNLQALEHTALNRWLADDLLTPIAEGKVTGVHVVLVLNQTEFNAKDCEIRHLLPESSRVNLGKLDAAHFPWLARNFCLQYSEGVYRAYQTLSAQLHPINSAWLAGEQFKKLAALCSSLENMIKQPSAP